MNRDALDSLGALLRDAELAAARPAFDGRPWPVVMLSIAGGWLAVLPVLLLFVFVFFMEMQSHQAGYAIGPAAIVVAVLYLRHGAGSIFAEQFAGAILASGFSLLASALFSDWPVTPAAAVLALLACVLAAALPLNWMRAMLGAAAASLLIVAMLDYMNQWKFLSTRDFSFSLWRALHASLACWLACQWLQQALLRRGHQATVAVAGMLTATASGWLVVVLGGLALYSGPPMLASPGSPLGQVMGTVHRDEVGQFEPAVSAVLALAAAGWLMWQWPGTRRWWLGAATLPLAALAWWLPALGAALLVLCVCAVLRQRYLAGTAALVAASVLGSAYYQLHWTLLLKGGLFAAAGTGLLLAGWAGLHSAPATLAPPLATPPAPTLPRQRRAIALAALLLLASINLAIWQKERLIAHGTVVYVELAPLDPRSLVGGDYMQLNPAIPRELAQQWQASYDPRGLLIRRGADGVARFVAPPSAPNQPPGPDEYWLNARVDGRRLILESNVWYFREGDGARLAQARYGEYRIDARGQALLVGLRGAGLAPL